MSQTINCPSCGAANQFPEGKNSMFCAFCGSSIINTNIIAKSKSRIKKSKIKHGDLIFHNREIESLQEIIDLYSDNELDEITFLDLSHNNISSLKGLSAFKYVDKFILNHNKFKNISDSELEIINKITLNYDNKPSVLIELENNSFENYDWIDKINYDKIVNSYRGRISWHNGKMKEDKDSNSAKFCIATDKKTVEKYHPLSYHEKAKLPKKTGCFIATATMGSYEHPTVMELRYFRDNWILQKSWGDGFVQWYYHYGGVAAKFIEKSFILKMISYLFIVKPLFYLSRIVKNNIT